MPVTLDGKNLTIEDVERVARHNETVTIPDAVMEDIQACREIVDRKVEAREIMYGVTTGIGELSEVVLTPEQTKMFQKYLIYSHAAGCGKPLPVDVVRAAIASRINVLCKGRSGLRPVVVETLVQMLNRGVTPVVCEKGSVGACGDLSPMAQMALVPMGEGEALYKGERLSGKEAMERAGIPTIVYEARDGLATINGSNMIAGMGSLQLCDAMRWVKTSEITAGVTLDALNANMLAYDERLHTARGYPGAVVSARNIRKVVDGGDFLTQTGKKVQDAYSLRSTPQVVGAARDSYEFSRRMFEIELNGVGDNPLFFPDEGGICITGANFQGTPLAFALEMLGTAVTTIATLSERRTNRLMNPHLSMGLPAFLTKGAGMFAGLMLTQYTAGMLVCENRILSHPAATGSIPAAADQEDFVSMGMTTALKTRQILENANAVLAIELMAGAQALDFRKPLRPGRGVQAAYDVVRSHVDHVDEDRPLFDDINALTEAVKSGEVLRAVEEAIGALE
ncbi:phenylalanine ammonia-lyase [candidate division TA06 bacterium DG_24]|uniref:Phenylalanine ammonia-lyase n=2 Tax=Bacteria division TA06 TaxID=1156500 RepID=A0A0S8G975_UNCT6|nr:MAG: phenylalanine ammonia-lyase [candidate division TA06 bacterium DG_24]KPK69273.1 MAG: phenylalanine ammonia-lyase [candidate division TA06 bacterium SM23_40]